jgi:hypothetical protein
MGVLEWNCFVVKILFFKVARIENLISELILEVVFFGIGNAPFCKLSVVDN